MQRGLRWLRGLRVVNEPAPLAGVSLGWRPETAWLIHRRKDLAFTEVVAENLRAEVVPAPILQLRRRGVTVVPHGVSLSLGGAEGYSSSALDHLARVAELLDAPFVSEHVAFVRADGVEAGHLLPVARTEKMLDVIVANVRRVQRVLPVPLALEPIASLFEWPDAEMDEATFVSEVLARTGTRLVLDLANLYANAQNHHSDPLSLFARISRDQIAYVHVAGGRWEEEVYHDTHAAPTPTPVLDLLEVALGRFGALPVLVERDHHFGTRGALEAELGEVAEVVGRAVAVPPVTPLHATAPREDVAHTSSPAALDREQQALLVQSLVLEQPPPPGFDRRRLALASRALEQKRARGRAPKTRRSSGS